MSTRSWIRRLFARAVRGPLTPVRGARLPDSRRPCLEALEDRTLLSLTPTSISVSAASAALAYGQSETFTATVRTASGAAPGPVSFYDGATLLGIAPLAGSPATATFTTTQLPAGSHTITARYLGNGSFAASASGVEPTAAQSVVPTSGLYLAKGLAVDSFGDLFIADSGNDEVVEVNAGGQTSVGTGFDGPYGVGVSPGGSLLVADTLNDRVVRVGVGTQTTLYSPLHAPHGVAMDGAGDIFIADTDANQVLKFDSIGLMSTIGSGLASPYGVAVDGAGDVFIADTGKGRVVEVKPDGTQVTLASHDQLAFPVGVAADGAGAIRN